MGHFREQSSRQVLSADRRRAKKISGRNSKLEPLGSCDRRRIKRQTAGGLNMFPRLRSFWQTIWNRSRFERDLDDEMRFHLAERMEGVVRAGCPRRSARRLEPRR